MFLSYQHTTTNIFSKMPSRLWFTCTVSDLHTHSLLFKTPLKSANKRMIEELNVNNTKLGFLDCIVICNHYLTVIMMDCDKTLTD